MSKRFHGNVVDSRDAVDEETKVDVCLHGMENEYRVFLENLHFFPFSN